MNVEGIFLVDSRGLQGGLAKDPRGSPLENFFENTPCWQANLVVRVENNILNS